MYRIVKSFYHALLQTHENIEAENTTILSVIVFTYQNLSARNIKFIHSEKKTESRKHSTNELGPFRLFAIALPFQSNFVGSVDFSFAGALPKNLAMLGTVKSVAANRNGSVNLVITQAIANVPTVNNHGTNKRGTYSYCKRSVE